MKIYGKILSVLSIICFGFCLCLLVVSIDMELDWSIKLWSIVMLIWHGSFGGIGVYEFMRRKDQ